jgi:hypothetical protein
MGMHNKLKYLQKIIKNRHRSVIVNRDTATYFKTVTIAACFHEVGNCCWDKLKLKINLRTGVKVFEQPFITKAEISSSPTDLDGPRCFKALQTSELEIGANDKNSEVCNEKGRLHKWELL